MRRLPPGQPCARIEMVRHQYASKNCRSLSRAFPFCGLDLWLRSSALPACHHPLVRQISCGGRHSLALASGGRLYGWGCSTRGQLGPVQAEKPSCLPRLLFPLGQASSAPAAVQHTTCSPELSSKSGTGAAQDGRSDHSAAGAVREAAALGGSGAGVTGAATEPVGCWVCLVLDAEADEPGRADNAGARADGQQQRQRGIVRCRSADGGMLGVTAAAASTVLAGMLDGEVLGVQGGWSHTVVQCGVWH
jgi:hypothetical protein